MSTREVTQNQILKELRDLESDKWGEVLDFIGYLKYRTTPKRTVAHSQDLTAYDLLESELVGIWAGRKDIGDSLTFARQLRQQAGHRWRARNDLA